MSANPMDFAGIRRLDRTYVIAEAEINHNGDVELALRMVDVAKDFGADAIKFQYVIADEIATPDSPFYKIFKQAELGHEQFRRVFARAREIGLDCFITVPSNNAIAPVLDLDPPMLKIGSTNLTNIPLLRAIGETGRPAILSTGLGTLGEIEAALTALNADPSRIALMHCTVQYPAPANIVNLRAIRTMQAAFPEYLVGYSDHTEGEVTAVAAVALGARMLEKHYTLDRGMPGPDHGFSTDPAGFRRYVEAARLAESALGDGRKVASAPEQPLLRSGRRYLVAARDIAAGEPLAPAHVALRRIRPELEGIAPAMIDYVLGMPAPRAYRTGDAISWADFRKAAK